MCIGYFHSFRITLARVFGMSWFRARDFYFLHLQPLTDHLHRILAIVTTIFKFLYKGRKVNCRVTANVFLFFRLYYFEQSYIIKLVRLHHLQVHPIVFSRRILACAFFFSLYSFLLNYLIYYLHDLTFIYSLLFSKNLNRKLLIISIINM